MLNFFYPLPLFYRYDKVKVQKIHLKKLDRQQDILEKEMFIGN